MQLPHAPDASAEQLANLAMFRAHTQRRYTEEYPTNVKFSASLALLEGQLRDYWSKEDAAELIEHLTFRSWSFTSPHAYIYDFVQLLLKGIKKNGDTLEGLKMSGLLEVPDAIEPIHNGDINIAEQVKPAKFKDKLNKAFKANTPKRPPLGSN